MYKIGVLFIFLIYQNSCTSQIRDSVQVTKCIISDSKRITVSVEYTNYSDSTYYFWIYDKELNQSQSELIRLYFSALHQDFTLSNLIYENLLSEENMALKKSFIKKLYPNKRFSIHVSSNTLNEDNLVKIIKSKVVIVNESDVINKYKFNLLSVPSFTSEDLFLLEQDL